MAFKYVSARGLEFILKSCSEGECQICGKQQTKVLNLWRWPNSLNFCLACIDHNGTLARDVIMRSPLTYMREDIPADQAFEMLFMTPPTKGVSDNHDEPIWPRHCGDFCQYDGEADLTEIDENLMIELADSWDVDVENIQYSIEDGGIWVHKFHCLKCGEPHKVFDYSY